MYGKQDIPKRVPFKDPRTALFYSQALLSSTFVNFYWSGLQAQLVRYRLDRAQVRTIRQGYSLLIQTNKQIACL
ncbi:MAG: hypothetical protein A3F61_00120 [Candidatus Blackburnbacteria bacterium RIFCSPHIGHO2_12_FULL_41_13b]|uniref:Uncharacterized protein n=1 Tax=Candidatus Blackburnbacteria bacterium RIFCSPHIGHO2_12_FULL_41_13b TaxID=1797517 RepID=A0A1G1V7V2_9BACT|nr:MAG: hypothetical protein A3F61_00120 [Candidatus Blackburnbacteria bacterium RIFCSPHIGHO2_12_FULL_41_13b]